MMNGTRKIQRGFTLIEMIMVIIILAIISAIGSQMLGSGFNAYFDGRDIVNAEWQGRFAMQRMARELRDVRSATPADLIMAANQITFTDTNANVITYQLAGSTLTRNGQALADGVSSLDFYYIQDDGINAAVIAGDVVYISVAISVSLNGANYNHRHTVHPRSF